MVDQNRAALSAASILKIRLAYRGDLWAGVLLQKKIVAS